MLGVAVAVAMLAGCGFSISVESTPPGDARPDTARDAEAPDIAPDANLCPPFYRAIGSGIYAVLDPTGFKNHMSACASHGTHLAVIDSMQELTDLVVYGRTVAGVNVDSRFYVGLIQAPDQTEPDDNWIDFFDRDAAANLWASSGDSEPNDGPDDNETNHQEQVGALQLNRSALVDLSITSNVRAYCECDQMAIGPEAQMYINALP